MKDLFRLGRDLVAVNGINIPFPSLFVPPFRRAIPPQRQGISVIGRYFPRVHRFFSQFGCAFAKLHSAFALARGLFPGRDCLVAPIGR